jgi:hypothetical protein
MFGLLNPFILWLAPLLAGPLIIHFLGRAEPKPRDFPSLMPVRGQLLRAMQRHRLKNWLQLLLRTLLLLCLLLAAADPVWRSPARWSPPETSALLLHNGAYAAAPARSLEGETRAGTLGDAQQRLRRGLDSLTPGRSVTQRVIPEARDDRPAARFGRYAEAVSGLLRQAEGSPAAHVFLPVFDARDLDGLGEILRPWLEEHPRARVALIDHGDAARGLAAFSAVRADFETEGEARLRVATTARRAPLWKSAEGAARETRLRDGVVDIRLPLPESGTLQGLFVLDAAERHAFAESAAAVSYRIPPPATLCHLSSGSGWMTRATMGEGGKRLRILSMSSGAELPAATCDLLYLADPENPDAALLARAASVLRTGGKVIVGTGSRTDAALLNRNLLQPLGVGRLTALESHGSLAARTHPEALARLGAKAEAWGKPGAVRRHLGFEPASGTEVLLSVKDGNSAASPLLVHRRAGTGELLLWTTDIGDPAWSDIAQGPWAALMHPAFFGRAWAGGPEPREVASDSTLFLPVPEGESATLRGPDGNPTAAWHPEPGGGRAGPFDRTGLYRLETSRDTLRFAVNLAPSRLAPLQGGSARQAWNAFDEALGERAALQVERLDAASDWRGLYGGFRLRLTLLLLAALLLFAEGVVSLRLSPFRD